MATTMVRFNKKATKIAFAILGTPGNLKFKQTKRQKYIEEQLMSQESYQTK